MFRNLKTAICAIVGLAALQQASGFSVFGPAEPFETPTLDYITRYYYGNDSEIGGTKILSAGSRLNVPVLTYAYDSTFLTYFGTKGVAAVDAAMAVMNGLPTASTPNLANFLQQGNQVINYTAQALVLTDLKSTVMSIMIEHMGLIGETHVWDLRNRVPLPGGQFEYTVINSNYDPVTWDPTAYVNGVQYYYSIWDGSLTNGVSVADAIENTVDQTSSAQLAYTAVATRYGQQPGGYYLRITRDDMGGLSYLYRKNHYAYELLDSNSVAGFNTSPYNPISFNNTTNNVQGVMGGVEKITYVKVAYDSQIGNGFTPRRYNYTIPFVTNGALRTLTVTRTIFQPDIIFAAGDLVGPATTYPLTYNAYSRGFNFISNGIVSPGGGVEASVITPQEIITFNDVNPVYVNISPHFLDEIQFGLYPVVLWGSFDGSTNAPTVYPSGTSLANLEQEIVQPGASIDVGLYNPVSFNTNAATGTGSSTLTTTQ
jgi:hypothetical protein